MRISLAMLLFAAIPTPAQFSYPQSASTRLLFAQLADGGAPDQQWTTTLLLSNPDGVNAATVRISFYGDNGAALPLDFGTGSATSLTIDLPAGGSKVLSTTGGSSTKAPVTGWARADSNIPVFGTLFYRAAVNGKPLWDVAAAGSGATFFFTSQAAFTTGVALANPSGTDTIHVKVSGRDQNGTATSSLNVTLPPLTHQSFGVGSALNGVGTSFRGVITVATADSPPSPFVVAALYERDGLLSPLPPGGMAFPAPNSRIPKDVWTEVVAGATPLMRTLGPAWFRTTPDEILQALQRIGVVVDDGATLKASYSSFDNNIHISRAMLETMGTSESALAFVLSHVAARTLMQQLGYTGAGIWSGVPERTAADGFSLLGLFATGFDPGGMADFYGRYYVAGASGVTIDAGLLNLLGPVDQEPPIRTVWQELIQACAFAPELATTCKQVHDYWHPSYPASIP